MKRTGQTYTKGIKFESLTRTLLNPLHPDTPECPDCGHEIDFTRDIEWVGPTAFLCSNCGRIIEISELDGL
ncbi:MAG: hypothetical protein AM324_013855 [Candidatus Thorarchaeota archaeon SMTZ1-83]|nr:MAG: hypothetical protein AM324_14990 [Candidatus Thorarchaeota archaeon SMTZ1-83]